MYTAECKIPIPTAVKGSLSEIKFAVYQGLGKVNSTTVGVYANDTTPDSIVTSADVGRTAAITVTLPSTIADDEVRYVGEQSRVNPDDESKRDVRFLAVMGDYTAYEEIGFDLTWVEQTADATVNSTTVYTSIEANGNTIYAENYGGKYFFAYTLTGLTEGTYTFKVSAFTKKVDAEAVPGTEYTVTVTVDSEGVVTFG